MAVMFLALVWWMMVQMTVTRVRLQILGCFGGEPFQTPGAFAYATLWWSLPIFGDRPAKW